MQWRRHGATIGGGGREPFELDSFDATPIGILNVENIPGDRSPRPSSVAAQWLDGDLLG